MPDQDKLTADYQSDPLEGSISQPPTLLPASDLLLVVAGDTVRTLNTPRLTAGQRRFPVWSYQGSGPISRLLIVDGTIYFSAGQELVALDARTGDVLWTYKARSTLLAPVDAGDYVCAVDDQATVYPVLKSNGLSPGPVRFRRGKVGDDPATDGRSLFFLVDSTLVALDLEDPGKIREEKWAWTSEGANLSGMTVANGLVFVLGDQVVAGIDAGDRATGGGTRRWSSDVSGVGGWRRAIPFADQGRLLLVAQNGDLYCARIPPALEMLQSIVADVVQKEQQSKRVTLAHVPQGATSIDAAREAIGEGFDSLRNLERGLPWGEAQNLPQALTCDQLWAAVWDPAVWDRTLIPQIVKKARDLLGYVAKKRGGLAPDMGDEFSAWFQRMDEAQAKVEQDLRVLFDLPAQVTNLLGAYLTSTRNASAYDRASRSLETRQEILARMEAVGIDASQADPDLVGRWRLDDGIDTVATDSSPYRRDGQLVGPGWDVPLPPTDPPGPISLRFDGKDDYVRIEPGDALGLKQAATLAAWIYPTGPGSGQHGGTIVQNGDRFKLARFGDGTIRWNFAGQGDGDGWVNTDYVAPEKRWTHIAVTYDGYQAITYADGQMVHTFPVQGPIGHDPSPLDGMLLGGGLYGDSYFEGRLSEVCIYRRALAAGEVRALVTRQDALAWALPSGGDADDDVLVAVLDVDSQVAPTDPAGVKLLTGRGNLLAIRRLSDGYESSHYALAGGPVTGLVVGEDRHVYVCTLNEDKESIVSSYSEMA